MSEILNNAGFTDFTLASLSTPSGVAQLNAILQKVANNIAGDTDQVRVFTCIGTPESQITAGVGSLAMRSDGGADTSVYRKESGSGNTGWVAIKAPASLPLSLVNGGLGADASGWTVGDYIYMASSGVIGHITPPINHGQQLFTASGTFTAPTGITKVYLTMVGAGGGGGAALNGAAGGGGAGAGQWVINYPYTVIAGNNYTVTINAGGTGGAATNNDGTDGGTSVFDALTMLGGLKGLTTGNGGLGGGAVSGVNFLDASSLVSTAAQTGAKLGKGGNGAKNSVLVGGGGGATPFGNGGDGGSNGVNGTAATANTGAGGGGGGASNSGGNGGSGFVLVMY